MWQTTFRSLATVAAMTAMVVMGCGGKSHQSDGNISDGDATVPELLDCFANIDSNGFVGANVPFGMIAWGPNSPEGYSLTNLSGAEMPQRWQHYVPVRPSISNIKDAVLHESVDKNNSGVPGLFKGSQIPLAGDPISVELTATTRTGFGRFMFPANSDPKVLIYCTRATQDSPNQISGYHDRGAGFKVYFVAIFEKPITAIVHFFGGVAVRFDLPADPVLQLKIGMSYVTTVNALANLNAENTGWDFEAVSREARRKWIDALSRIAVNGSSPEERTLFYTYLYQVFHHPSIASDVNGEYLGFDYDVHRVEAGHEHYTDFSIWDTYRGQVQLLAFLFPKATSDMIQSLIDDAAQDGTNGGSGVMPRWVVANRETGVMETGSATPLVTSAFAFGAKDFDTEAAWRAMERVETIDGLSNQGVVEHYRIGEFIAKGYVPYYGDYQGKQCASFTLEYCIGDYALAQFAKALGKSDDANDFLSLSHNWQNLFNSSSLYIQPKMPDGCWRPGFSPAIGHFEGFVEGTSSQYTWMIPHDWDTLFQKMGGTERVISRLDHYFTRLNDAYNTWNSEYHCAGNEPGFFTVWAYNSANAPAKTQQIVRRILTEQFDHKLPGADDLGAMSAWYVWASMGIYPILPGTDTLAINGPRFSEIVIRYADGRHQLTITGRSAAIDAPYIQALSVNGQPYNLHRMALSRATNSSPTTLAFTMGTRATHWATVSK